MTAMVPDLETRVLNVIHRAPCRSERDHKRSFFFFLHRGPISFNATVVEEYPRSVKIFTMGAEIAQASEERHMWELGRVPLAQDTESENLPSSSVLLPAFFPLRIRESAKIENSR